MESISDMEANVGRPYSATGGTIDVGIISSPPPGMVRVTNVYLDPVSGQLVVGADSETLDIAPASAVIQSRAVSGRHKIYSIFRNADGNLGYEWEDEPVL